MKRKSKNEIDVDKINASLNNQATFPTQLIACMVDYGFSALAKYLEESNAPPITGETIEALRVLAGVLEERAKGNGGTLDDLTGWAIGTTGRAVVELGENFQSPSGLIF